MKIEKLEKHHIRNEFKCEEHSLNHYLRNQARQDQKKLLSVCYVLLNNDNRVIGYYTLSTAGEKKEHIPERYRKKIPKSYGVPVILLGRLARDISQKGNGIGEILLIDALKRSYEISSNAIGAMAVVIDPINQKVEDFYLKYGFEKLPDSGKLFLHMDTIKKIME
ncbi:MAG TPA: GNAT family N-acetyltransferase [Cytophagales bacterium]|nr:GNAT family N-acetyltransferase [Cytophagales bacterium]